MPFNSSELVEACRQGDLAEVRRLVEAGADVNSIGEHGIGPLLTCSPEIARYLLARGADPNVQTNESEHPVTLGISYLNAAECVRLLLEAGADPNAVVPETGERRCTVHCAVEASAAERLAVVRHLLGHGADPNRKTIPGQPTLAFWRDVRTRGETRFTALRPMPRRTSSA